MKLRNNKGTKTGLTSSSIDTRIGGITIPNQDTKPTNKAALKHKRTFNMTRFHILPVLPPSMDVYSLPHTSENRGHSAEV